MSTPLNKEAVELLVGYSDLVSIVYDYDNWICTLFMKPQDNWMSVAPRYDESTGRGFIEVYGNGLKESFPSVTEAYWFLRGYEAHSRNLRTKMELAKNTCEPSRASKL